MNTSAQRRHLVLFTQHFPFGNKETFVELELPYLAEAFDTVRIVPAHVDGVARSLPSNVSCDESLARLNREKLIRPYQFRKNLLNVLQESQKLIQNPRNLRQFVARSRRMLRFLRTAEKLMCWFHEHPEISLHQTLFYSYWMEAIPVGLAFLKKQYAELCFVCRTHRWDLYEELYNPAWFPFRDVVLEQAHRVYSISDDGVNYLTKKHPAFGHKVELARLGVHTLGLSSASSDNRFRMVSCSGLTAVKRVHLIVEALSQIEKSHEHQIEWHHFGDGPLASKLKSQARAGLGDSVQFVFHGHTPNLEVRKYYVEHPFDLFINVSASEGVPVSVMEAQSAAIPVIATDVGGTSEIVNSENGILIEADVSPSRLAEHILKILDSPQRLSIYKRNSEKTWSSDSNAERQFSTFAERLRLSPPR